MKLINGNCLEEMKKLPDKSVDLFICDLPYTDMKGKGETNCSWNQGVLDLDEFWVQFKRLRKSKRTACIHFCSTRFGYSLIKSWEKGYRMDMVWKKRNKTGGLASRYRPMRNHEMVYFFYENAPKYNRDKYHKRINNVKHAKSETTQEKKSDKEEKPKRKSIKDRKGLPTSSDLYPKENQTSSNFEPPNPSSVIEETDIYGETKEHMKARGKGHYHAFEPPNPASVIEEDIYGEDKQKQINRMKNRYLISGNVNTFDPPNPASVIEEDEEKYTKEHLDNNRAGAGTNNKSEIYSKSAIKKFHKENGVGFEPPNPASVIEEDEEKIWGEKKKDRHQRYIECGCGYFEPRQPDSVFESGKVFIGKRNHQTEKPQDILEFFLKYYSDEGDVILDPTCGSGSTGVACKKMGREFIGIELTEKYYEVAKQRCGVEN